MKKMFKNARLVIMASQWSMFEQNWYLSSQTLLMPVHLTSHNDWSQVHQSSVDNHQSSVWPFTSYDFSFGLTKVHSWDGTNTFLEEKCMVTASLTT